jgi:hypothetical protein
MGSKIPPEVGERYERDVRAETYYRRAEERIRHWRFRLAGFVDDLKALVFGA